MTLLSCWDNVGVHIDMRGSMLIKVVFILVSGKAVNNVPLLLGVYIHIQATRFSAHILKVHCCCVSFRKSVVGAHAFLTF